MCRLVAEAASRASKCIRLLATVAIYIDPLKDKQVIADARRIVGEPEDTSYIPSDPKEFCGRLFHTCYMGTENSTIDTRKRAKDLAEAIGRYRQFVPRVYLR